MDCLDRSDQSKRICVHVSIHAVPKKIMSIPNSSVTLNSFLSTISPLTTCLMKKFNYPNFSIFAIEKRQCWRHKQGVGLGNGKHTYYPFTHSSDELI